MLKLFCILAVLRFLAGRLDTTYASMSGACHSLVDNARTANVDTVKFAYAMEAVDLDQNITQTVLNKFYLGFLNTNATYSSIDEVIEGACKMPYWFRTCIDWTDGFVSSVFVWCIVSLLKSVKPKLRNPSPGTPPHTPIKRTKRKDRIQEPPPKIDKPPIPPPIIKEVRKKKYIREAEKEGVQLLLNTPEHIRKRMIPP